MDSKPDISLLYDFYGGLIPESQQKVVELYVNDDLSLSEVAELLSISRQGVRDSLSRASKKLREYDSRLGLLKDHRERSAAAEAIRRSTAAIMSAVCDPEVRAQCDIILRNTDIIYEREEENGI